MSLQAKIWEASKQLEPVFNNLKDAKTSLKDMKKEFENSLKQNPEWVELDEKEKLLKVNKKEIWEQVKEIQKSKDALSAQVDWYEEIEEFKLNMEEAFNDTKDKTLNSLSKDFSNEWIDAEIEYKNWKLTIIVAKH